MHTQLTSISTRTNTHEARLRVLLVVESSGAGTGRHVCDLAEGLIVRGHDVHLIYSTGRADKMFLKRVAGMTGLRHQAMMIRTIPHPADFLVVRAIRRYMRRFGPFDLVHGHSSKGGALARLCAFGSGAKAFYTLHGLIAMDRGLSQLKRRFYQAIEVGLSLITSRIIAVSPEEQRASIGFGLGRSRVILVPNGIGPLDLAPRDEARRVLKVSHQEMVIGFVGRLVEQKAPDLLLNAFAKTLQTAPHARLAMVGAGPLDQASRDLAARLGVADKVIWLGERDARGVLAGFDLFALSSRKEGLPYVVLEAMAAGLPVVATSSAGVEILVKPGVNGAVVKTGDVMAFADALIQFATNDALLKQCGEASRARVALFTVDRMVDLTLQAYYDAFQTRSAHAHPAPPDDRMKLEGLQNPIG